MIIFLFSIFLYLSFFFFNDTATTEIYTLSLHDALPIYGVNATPLPTVNTTGYIDHAAFLGTINPDTNKSGMVNRSEERFSRNAETDLVCRLLLEKKKKRRFLRLSWITRFRKRELYSSNYNQAR